MTAPFECEVRFLIDDIHAFRQRIAALGGRARFEYAFTDHYFRPGGGASDPRARALRIREHHRPAQPCEILLTWIDLVQVSGMSFKRSRFPEGKVRLYTGTLEECRAVMGGLGYESWLVVHKTAGALYEIPGLGELVAEQVDGVGWMCEVEVAGEDPAAAARAIRRKLEALAVPPETVMSEPLAAVVAARARPAAQRVYFCGAIRGGRSLQPLYASLVGALQRWGYLVLTTHVAAPDVLEQEWRPDVRASDIYERDMQWLSECDFVVAEVSVPSLGVGVEIATAQQLGKPVFCLCRTDVALSALIEGNTALRVIRYGDEAELMDLLERELRDRGPGTGDQNLARRSAR